jgi:hypothetical protein
MNDKVQQHKNICYELNALYAKKNHDYGDAFHLSYIEEGMAMPRIRLGDKLNRFKTLSKNLESREVQDESIRDTLLDLANYAIMTILELESESESKVEPDSDVTLIEFRGEMCKLVRCGDKLTLYSQKSVICDACRFNYRLDDLCPCGECYHGEGDKECFELDHDRAEVKRNE